MSYVKEMLNNEERKMKEQEKSLQKLVLRAGKHIDRNVILGLRGTKAIKVEDMSNTNEEYDNRESWGELLLSAHNRPMSEIYVTTWSSLIRNTLKILEPQLTFVLNTFGSEHFREVYEICMKELFDSEMIRSNSNFVKRLYKESEEEELINSTVYLSNRNHKLEIFTDENGTKWYACAVYTGEIIWVLEALLDTIYALYEDMADVDINKTPQHTIVISYINRDIVEGDLLNDETQNLVSDIDAEIERLNLAKDVISLQMKINRLSTMFLEINTDLNEIHRKYNLPSVDEIIKSV